MTDSKRISGADILAMRSQAAEAENYAIIAGANIDRLTQAYVALEIEVVKFQARLEAAERDAERWRAALERARAKWSELWPIGEQLSNVAFNWSQEAGGTGSRLTATERAALKMLQEKWDAAMKEQQP